MSKKRDYCFSQNGGQTNIVPIMLLNLFKRAGHTIDLVIGDFTASIGDPTDQQIYTPPPNREQINQSMKTYRDQIGKYINLDEISVHHNSSWFSSMSLLEIFDIFHGVSLYESIQREDFKNRAENNQALSLAEVFYGVLMGIDSLKLNSQVEIGGIDQLINFQQCKTVMKQTQIREEVILTVPLLEGTKNDGKKMSKGYENYIAVNDSADNKFGGIMSIPDRLISQYFTAFADIHELEIAELESFIAINPLEAKKQLATLIISLETKKLENGEKAREAFERKFAQKQICLEDCMELKINGTETILETLMKSGQFQSKSCLRRLFEQRAVRYCKNGSETEIVFDKQTSTIIDGLIRVGKRRFFKLVLTMEI